MPVDYQLLNRQLVALIADDCRDAGGRVTHGAVTEKTETLRVDDVHECAGHIVCDAKSMSEIVVPLSLHGQQVGVLDIDSPTPSRFGETDQRGVEIPCESPLSHRLVIGIQYSRLKPLPHC